MGNSARRAPAARHETLPTHLTAVIATAALLAVVIQLVTGSLAISPARAAAEAVPKAVFIVGPTNGLTDENLADAEKMAEQAEAAGMEVHRVFFPHATWDNVLANIQDANLVVYMGHGYGWPSPYTKQMTETRQDGMALNSFDGSARNQYTYYGATRLRESVHLAPNAIVYLNHLCYASGNGESDMPIPGVDLARQRVDNMASGWLAVGAGAVFAYGWWQRLNYPAALMNTDDTMDQMFMTPAPRAYAGSPAGYIGWNPSRFDSVRTPGATLHLDPHKNAGYYRALTGDMTMTAADWRASATGTAGGTSQVAPPQITALSAAGSSDAQGLTGGGGATFHPNGDGIDDVLVVSHTVNQAAYLDATVTNTNDTVVRRYSLWSAKGTTTSKWDGRNSAGTIVPDGRYTLTYVPRDQSGVTGTPVSIDVLVLTAAKLGALSASAFFARDGDQLSRNVSLAVKVNQQAKIGVQVVDAQGKAVRTVRAAAATGATTLNFAWDGRTDGGSWAPDGWYSMVVSASTALGSYSQARDVYVGAFRITPSTTSPKRGGALTLKIKSTEVLAQAPIVKVSQPGLSVWKATARKIAKRTYKVTLTLKSGGTAGALGLDVSGVDKYGGRQNTVLTLDLR